MKLAVLNTDLSVIRTLLAKTPRIRDAFIVLLRIPLPLLLQPVPHSFFVCRGV
jgi:hypothetical protein